MLRKILLIATAALMIAGTAAAQDNMLDNPSFEDGFDPWTGYGTATLSIDNERAYEGSASLRAVVAEAGANFWDSGIQYKPEGLSFDAGTLHTWAFFAQSDPPVEINIKPEKAADPWTGYGAKVVNLTADWMEYWVEYTPDEDVSPASLTLHVAFEPSTIWLDHVRWYHGEYVSGELQTNVEPQGKAAAVWGSLKAR
ncbi:MAG: carbohydrate binding domain-containing protein [Candidatus Poribacteria bacterium]|nr:carbohydrate binding domain-containing protein [Candidatus Poribacteria bacterium]